MLTYLHWQVPQLLNEWANAKETRYFYFVAKCGTPHTEYRHAHSSASSETVECVSTGRRMFTPQLENHMLEIRFVL